MPRGGLQLARGFIMPGSRANLVGPSGSRQQGAARPTPGAARAPPAPGIQVVGIGASAGGLEACAGFLEALPAASGMAFILVQHLDPTHESLMVELLAAHTSLTVLQAAGGMPVEREHLYIIPPAFFLTVGDGVLRLRPAPASRGARLPFDALLLSMAQDCGARELYCCPEQAPMAASAFLPSRGTAAPSSPRSRAKPDTTACREAPSRPAPLMPFSPSPRCPRCPPRENRKTSSY